MISHRFFCVCLLNLLLSLSLPSYAQLEATNEDLPLEKVSLQLKWKYQYQFAGYIAAVEKGFYTEEGLDVELRPRQPDINVVNEVVSGKADYGIGGIGILAEYANGSPIKALAAVFQHDALVFMSRSESGIVSPYEMAGKRVMFDASNGNDAILRTLLNDAEIQLKDINIIPQKMGIDSLINNEVDVISGYISDQPYEFLQKKIPINIINPRNYGFDFYGDILFTSDDELKKYPGRAQRMLKASLKGWHYALEHSEEMINIIKQKYGAEQSLSRLRFEARETKKLILADLIPLGSIEPGRLKRIADIYAQLGVAPALPEKTLNHFIHQPSTMLSLTEDEQAWLQAHPVIKVGVDKDFAPYEWINKDGEYVGLAAEYINLLEERLGVKFDIISNRSWDELMTMAQNDEIDMLACLNETTERKEYLTFTDPYIQNPVVIINTDINGYIGSLKNLAGKTVALEKGNFSNALLSDEYPEITLLFTDTPRQALEKVARGEADAYIGDAAYANYQIKNSDLINLQFAGQTQARAAYRMGIVKNEPELLSIINKVLSQLSEQEKKEIESQWLGIKIDSGPQLKTLIQFGSGILLLFLLFSYWIYRLRQSRRALQESEGRLSDVLNTSPVPEIIIDNHGKITYLNQAFITSFGYDLSDIPTLDDWLLRTFPKVETRERFITQADIAFNKQYVSFNFESIETDLICKDGQRRSVIANARKVTSDTIPDTLIILYDITERKRAEEKLKLSGRVFTQAHEGILITDADGLIVDVNPAFSEITGYSREEILHQNPSILRSDKHDALYFEEMWNELRQQGHWQGEIWNKRKDGQLYAELLTISTLVDDYGETIHYLGMFSDITQSKEQQHALEMMAHYDVLTQLPNRTLFADRFKQAIAHSNRNKSLLAVVFLDLDGFKPVNDTYGHEAGDQLLIEVSARIQSCIRQDDTASRLGGDEFALLLNDVSSAEHCETLINRIRHAIELPYHIDGNSISCSASIGITLYPLDNADADTLLRHADQAMYQAKVSGRQRHHMFDTQQDEQMSEQQNQFKSIEDALISDQLVLFYQPKVNMRSGDIIGAEALIRWQHPERGLITPAHFLPVVQGSYLEINIGNWVIERAIKQLNNWIERGWTMEMSINISSRHLQWQGLFDHLDRVLAKYPNVPSYLIQLEVLESSVLTDINNISSIIETCRHTLDLKISLDDFGTGYSSLTHLRHLPVDTVKIDQSFVRDLIDDPNDYTIIDGVIGLTDAFHHQVIAEGVETTEHGMMLLAMGCDLAQGYAIAYPMSADDCNQWFTDYQPNKQWIDLANRQLNAEQTLLELMTLQINYWLNRVIANLESSPDTITHWPLMNHKKCHFSLWLEQAKKQNLFDRVWIESMKLAYTELYHNANSLKYQYQEDQHPINDAGIAELKAHFKTIELLLDAKKQQ